MIVQLENKNINVAMQMQKVFHASYSIEAKILNATDFPPLKRTLDEYRLTDTVFYGQQLDNKIVGIIEIRSGEKVTHVQSLVVHPKYFKQGIASILMAFVINKYHSQLLFVETGINNRPAIKLYEKCGFKTVNQWDTDCGIVKIRLERPLLTGI